MFLSVQYESFTTESFAGIETAGQVPSDAVCTFFGFYNNTSGQRLDIEPAQCVAGGPVDGRLLWVSAAVMTKFVNLGSRYIGLVQ